MNKSKKLTTLFTGAAAVMLLSGTSAFADYRHRAETRSDLQTQQQNDQRRNDSRQSRDNRAQDGSGRHWDRSQAPAQAITQGRRDNSRFDRSQTYNQSRGESQRYDNRSYSRSQSYNRAPARNESRSYSGRVNRIEHWNNGYRVWVGGAPYPFFIGADRWARFPLRVGLNIRLGGYWDPIGYYNVYDVGPYATAGDLHGVVESVDYRRGTAVLRDDVSGSFVTIVLRGNDPRFGDLRPGDLVDLTGAWNRAGVFDAYNVADLRPAGYGGGYDNRY